MESRRIIINQSNGVPCVEIETTAQTWIELKQELDTAGIRYSGMKEIVGETQNVLGTDNALLGEGSLNVYLLPIKTKSGDLEPTKSKNMTKKTPAKKATVKKTATKSATTEKKVAPKKAVIKKAIENQEAQNDALEEKGKLAAQETMKVLNDTEKICAAISILKTIDHDKVGARLQAVVNELDDMSYICATGRPRIDNLKSKQTALQLDSRLASGGVTR